MAQKIETILLRANDAVAGSDAAARKLEVELRAAGFRVERDVAAATRRGVDLVILLGGDGFLMEVIRELDYAPARIFGVNFGTVGFLMNPRRCLDDLARLVREGRFRSEEHFVLEARIRRRSGDACVAFAFNDVVLERKTGQSIRFLALVDEVEFNSYSGDGIIIATPGGSTAYNLAAGGPVVHPGVGAMVITPLYPHRAAPYHSLEFSLLVPLSRCLRIVGKDVDKRPMRVLADGRPFEDVESVEVRDSGRRIELLRLEAHSFIETLSRTIIGRSELPGAPAAGRAGEPDGA